MSKNVGEPIPFERNETVYEKLTGRGPWVVIGKTRDNLIRVFTGLSPKGRQDMLDVSAATITRTKPEKSCKITPHDMGCAIVSSSIASALVTSLIWYFI